MACMACQWTMPGHISNTEMYLDVNQLPQKGNNCCLVCLAQGIEQLLLRTLPFLALCQCAYQAGLQLRTLSGLRQDQLRSTAPSSPLTVLLPTARTLDGRSAAYQPLIHRCGLC